MLEFCTYVRKGSEGGGICVLEVQVEMIGGTTLKGDREFATPPMAFPEEVDTHIDAMIENLERVREEAKGKLSENCF